MAKRVVDVCVPDCALDERRHDSNPESRAAHDEDFDKFAAPFEVLRDHKRRTVTGHADTHT